MSDFKDLRSRTVTGAVAGNITVTGIKKGDRLIHVQPVSAVSADRVAEFTVTADDTINNTGGTTTATLTLYVEWEAMGGGRYGAIPPALGRSSY